MATWRWTALILPPKKASLGLRWSTIQDSNNCLRSISIAFDFTIPITFPHYLKVVPVLEQKTVFLLSEFIQFLNGTIRCNFESRSLWWGCQWGQPCHRHPWNSYTVLFCTLTSSPRKWSTLYSPPLPACRMRSAWGSSLEEEGESRRRRCSCHASHLYAFTDWLERVPCHPCMSSVASLMPKVERKLARVKGRKQSETRSTAKDSKHSRNWAVQSLP